MLVTKNFVRFASTKSKKSDKISVQLLKNFPSVGKAGEIVSVKPSYMRSVLHVNNGACYLNDGPRIPVVDKTTSPVSKPKPVKSKVVEEPKVESQTTPSDKTGTMSLDELSSLFKTIRSNTKTKNTEAPSTFGIDREDLSYTSSDLRELIPSHNTLMTTENIQFPLSKQFISEYLFNVSGIDIPVLSIRLADGNNEPITEIKGLGNYSLFINTSEKKEVQKSLTVHD